jgi:dihydroneopterin aldolase
MTRSLSITIEGIELRGRCGVTPEERSVGQTLVVDVRLEPSARVAGETDDLGDTVDYGRVVDLVRAVVEGGEFHLLERLATVIAEGIWDVFEPALLEVAVTKPSPPVSIPVGAARVEVVRTS